MFTKHGSKARQPQHQGAEDGSGHSSKAPRKLCQVTKKADCPIPGACNQDGAVYEATVSTSDGQTESYVGLARTLRGGGSSIKPL